MCKIDQLEHCVLSRLKSIETEISPSALNVYQSLEKSMSLWKPKYEK